MSCPFTRAMAPDRRADPYPLYAEMPPGPTRLADGRFVVAGFHQVQAMLHDPRLSSAGPRAGSEASHDPAEAVSLLRLDPPEHDRLRRIVMRQFGPPHRPDLVASLEPVIAAQANLLLDAFPATGGIDIVPHYAHRLPFLVICRLLAIPVEDEPTFHRWIADILAEFGTARGEEKQKEAIGELGRYLAGIAMSRRGGDGTDMLSGLVNDDGPDGRLPEASVGAMARLLLIAGHETTVNLIGNGVLTLIRHPGQAARLAGDPVRAAAIVEELLRLEPPVQFIGNRTATGDIETGGVTIPAGSTVILLVAAANRDPAVFAEPDRFDPDRPGNRHLGFGGGIHACFGAPLARLEAQIALRLFAERVVHPRLSRDPEYRPSPLLRGPREMHVAYDAIRGGTPA